MTSGIRLDDPAPQVKVTRSEELRYGTFAPALRLLGEAAERIQGAARLVSDMLDETSGLTFSGPDIITLKGTDKAAPWRARVVERTDTHFLVVPVDSDPGVNPTPIPLDSSDIIDPRCECQVGEKYRDSSSCDLHASGGFPVAVRAWYEITRLNDAAIQADRAIAAEAMTAMSRTESTRPGNPTGTMFVLTKVNGAAFNTTQWYGNGPGNQTYVATGSPTPTR